VRANFYEKPLTSMCWRFIFHRARAPSGQGPPLYRGFTITLN